MDALKTALTLLTVATVIGPLFTAFMIYRDNLSALLVPEIDLGSFGLPILEYVSYTHDPSVKTIYLMINLTNPYNISLKVNSFSGRVLCHEHKAFLGNISLAEKPIIVPPRASVIIALDFNYTDEGERHFLAYHNSTDLMYVDLDFSMNIQGIILYGNYTVGPISLEEYG